MKPGETVTVADAAGIEHRGRILALSSSSIDLTVDDTRRTFAESDVRTISQRRASPGKGAKWGFFVGSGVGVLGALEIAADDEWDYSELGKGGAIAVVLATYAGLGAAVGVGIGALIRQPHVVYAGRPTSSAALRLSPVLSFGRKGVAMSLLF